MSVDTSVPYMPRLKHCTASRWPERGFKSSFWTRFFQAVVNHRNLQTKCCQISFYLLTDSFVIYWKCITVKLNLFPPFFLTSVLAFFFFFGVCVCVCVRGQGWKGEEVFILKSVRTSTFPPLTDHGMAKRHIVMNSSSLINILNSVCFEGWWSQT